MHSTPLVRFVIRLRWLWGRIPRTPRRRGVLVAIYLFWRERFTPAGKTAGALWLFALFLEALPGLSGVWPVLALLTGAFMAAWLLSFRRPPGSFTLCTPARVRCGDSVVLICDPTPEAAEGHAGIFLLHDDVMALESGKQQPWRIPVRARQPGRYAIESATLLRNEPLGLMRARRRVPQQCELVVHPRPAHIASFDFLTQGRSGQTFSQLMSRSSGRSSDFLGIRPFRPGDSLRDLHQQAFARYGQPFSREYAAEESGGLVLALETAHTRWNESFYWPYAVRLCAGLALWLQERQWLGGFAIDGELFRLPRENAVSFVLDLLAAPPVATGSTRSLSCQEPVLVIGCSAQRFTQSLGPQPDPRHFKRLGVGAPRHDPVSLPDTHLWLDWLVLYKQIRSGKGLPL